MSGGLDVLALREDDVTKMLAATTHLGSENVNFQMEQYIYKRRLDGTHIINLRRTWEKLQLAARAIAAIEHPADVFAISSRPFGQRAVLKFSFYTGATPIAGRFTPGAFTNQIQAAFREPRLLVVTDPRTDHQPVTEASYVNIPVIAFCNTDSPLRYVDIAIPCNTKSSHSAGLMWWMLAREVLRLRGIIPREGRWEVVVDLFFYRDPEDSEKEEQQAKELVPLPKPDVKPELTVAAVGAEDKWAEGDPQPANVVEASWTEDTTAPAAPTEVPGVPGVPGVPAPAPEAPAADEWSEAAPKPDATWGGAGQDWS